MLEGYDKKWTLFNSIAEASYSQIPVGNYIFKVRYKKDVFDTAYQTFSIPLRISPLWYQTPLAHGLWAIGHIDHSVCGLFVAKILSKRAND